MSETPLNKLKNKGMDCASAVLTRVDLAMEESKLRRCFTRLGQKLHGSIKTQLFTDVKNDSSMVELLGEIEERTKVIKELKSRLNKRVL
ncbi:MULTISPECIES: hypothetical protein [unclassified Fibrobacter]|uniref:hypothetical protein n=1 Tax=unclassified Fibrobacter TaxID=2634177 RepID=UPI000D6D4F9F|nr:MULTISPECIES: hypothetical protein [unclassified Fibrobacter]PWJ68351.1 hypothetical protein BGX12_10877 [Fibrobacter sp. UWR4]PZW68115.1 hypothetical protein C8E88_102022 [Fibrobacter sp. UWR1]